MPSLDDAIEKILTKAGREMVAAIRASLSEEVRRLANGARGGNGVRASKRSRHLRRSSKEIAKAVEGLLAFVSKNPGLRTEEIVKRLGGNSIAIKDGLARLRSVGRVKTSGVKRAMTYRVA